VVVLERVRQNGVKMGCDGGGRYAYACAGSQSVSEQWAMIR
jgi:hypothetical protein